MVDSDYTFAYHERSFGSSVGGCLVPCRLLYSVEIARRRRKKEKMFGELMLALGLYLYRVGVEARSTV